MVYNICTWDGIAELAYTMTPLGFEELVSWFPLAGPEVDGCGKLVEPWYVILHRLWVKQQATTGGQGRFKSS